jgi:orotidine-5'-phosphate decarboxylase
MPLLVPGVGAQGGDVEAVVKNGCTADGYGLIINSSRGIIYASAEADFAEAAKLATETLRDTINQYRGL